VHAGLQQVAHDTAPTFGALTPQQLNWRPSTSQWSVAQCLEHLISANRMMLQSMDDAFQGRDRTIWMRLPWMPRLMGRALIRSQAPEGTRKFKADPRAQPATSDIGVDVVARFVAQHHDVAARANALDETVAARTIMTSPFIRIVTYSVLDGWRIVLAHDHRHVEQARRVMRAPGFP
jgi:hypothetical protein